MNDEKNIFNTFSRRIAALTELLNTGCVWKRTVRCLVEPRLTAGRVHNCVFCRKVKTAAGDRCLANDTRVLPKLLRSSGTRPFLHACHAGALEYTVPLTEDDGVVAGVLIFGPYAPPGESQFADELPIWRPELAAALTELASAVASPAVLRRSGGQLDLSENLDRRLISAAELAASDSGVRATLAAAAKRAHLSTSRFSHLFRTGMGMSYSAFRLKCKLERAGELLAGTDLAVSDVAAAAGFANLSHFSAAFRRYYGASPSEFRRRRTVTV